MPRRKAIAGDACDYVASAIESGATLNRIGDCDHFEPKLAVYGSSHVGSRRTVEFLSADDAGFITGANIPVNGGYFMDF